MMKPVMLCGTGSDVGKSVIATALCRIFRQDGYLPAPFKAQNMALNSYVTPDGLELGRAQAVQAEAAGVPCHTDMNPILLKPQSDHTSQVVLNGRPVGNSTAWQYYRNEGHEELRQAAYAAFDRLTQRFHPIVMEGAGSISEINLRKQDLVNLPMAAYAGAVVILVADIDRGGIFASCYGSIALQTPADKARIKGIIVNKFRGDMKLFEKGRQMLADICGVPVLGVVPYFRDIQIEEEDSVSLARKQTSGEQGLVNVAVVLLRHISNFTDFSMLERDPRVHLFYTNNVQEIERADLIILPGSKSTIADLCDLRSNGCAHAILQAAKVGKTVIGICGGFQMLGQEVLDPHQVEGNIERMPGLGLLPVSTVMSAEKTTTRVEFEFEGELLRGYEIHNGRSVVTDGLPANEKVLVRKRVIGSYVHGLLDNAGFVDRLLSPYTQQVHQALSNEEFKELQYNLLADHVRKYVDMDTLYNIMNEQV